MQRPVTCCIAYQVRLTAERAEPASRRLTAPAMRSTTVLFAMPEPSPPTRRALRAWLAASSLLGLAVAGVLGGLALDRHFGTTPVWLLVCSTTAIVVGVYQLMRQVIR